MFYTHHTINVLGPENLACTKQTGPGPQESSQIQLGLSGEKTLEQTNKQTQDL